MTENESVEDSTDGQTADSLCPWTLPAQLLQEPAQFRDFYLQTQRIVKIGQSLALSGIPNGIKLKLQIQEHALPIPADAD
jgi:hypothetical protein